MIDDGHIVLGGIRVSIRTVAIAWGAAIALFGALSALVIMTMDASGILGADGGTGMSLKIVGIAVALLVSGLAGLSGFGLLGLGERQTLLGVATLGLTSLTALLTALSILVETSIPGDRILGALWVLTLFTGLFGLAIRLLENEQLGRLAAQVAAGAAAVGGVIGTIVTLVESTSTTSARVVGACAVLTVAGCLAGLLARHTDETELPASPTAFE